MPCTMQPRHAFRSMVPRFSITIPSLNSSPPLPPRIIQYSGHAGSTLSHNMSALMAATLYVAVRRADLGVVIPEVAAAAGVDARTVGMQYRCERVWVVETRGGASKRLYWYSAFVRPFPAEGFQADRILRRPCSDPLCRQVARTLGLSIPSANLRSLVIRHAMQVAAEFYPSSSIGSREMSEASIPQGPWETATRERLDAGAVTRGVSSSAAMTPGPSRSHRFVLPAVQLAEIVMRLKVAEGQTISTQAAAVLQIVAEAVPPPCSGPERALGAQRGRTGRPRKPPIHAAILSLFGADKGRVAVCKKAVNHKLLELSRMLPFGASVTADRVLQYLPT